MKLTKEYTAKVKELFDAEKEKYVSQFVNQHLRYTHTIHAVFPIVMLEVQALILDGYTVDVHDQQTFYMPGSPDLVVTFRIPEDRVEAQRQSLIEQAEANLMKELTDEVLAIMQEEQEAEAAKLSLELAEVERAAKEAEEADVRTKLRAALKG